MTMNDEENIKETTEETVEEISEETAEEENADTGSENAPETDEADKLAGENEKLKAEIDEWNDRYQRIYAEYDNYRNRTTKEKMEAYGDATAKCIQEILPVLDSFERAIEAECTDEAFKNGMEMIYGQFLDTLKKIGVTDMDALGKEFDPKIHSAIKQVEDESFGENTVCQVFQKGYMLGDRIIRHAVVAVAN